MTDTGPQKNDPLLSLQARYYTDDSIYQAELKGLLAKTWQFAGHISQCEEPGDYFTFEIAGEALFCIRDQEDALQCFYNVCQHRAHQLLSGSGNNKLIVCPYHAWNYHLTGELRAAPNTKSVPGFDKSKICLTKVRCEVLHGFIFVNLDTQAQPVTGRSRSRTTPSVITVNLITKHLPQASSNPRPTIFNRRGFVYDTPPSVRTSTK